MSTTTADQNLQIKCEEVVKKMQALNINFLALDFDLTIISFHTGGRPWGGTIEEMSSFVRPMFRHLIPLAHQAGIQIAVVTFSPQVKTISQVLEHLFPHFASSIPIRGHDRSWAVEGCLHGKQPHMASAIEEIYSNVPDVEITRNSTLLVDDDDNNIDVALNEGVRAIWLDPNHADDFFDDVRQLM
eukprot:CAMPEP_0196808782 /NCGR_PEP_ID=MMETSP1362-20130617/8778_1 /TAXON_ID=163516 /ORGANISM="Leptocylindrus danicus, Strain CCMP1856" /LENGTH=185 /DNA_ID=CAMNT_0042183247 /DNA_START=881 /DNA_END=1438 /DNA_ORIENTATION=-